MLSLRRILSAALILMLPLILTACGNGIEGSWKLSGGNAIGAIYSLGADNLDSADAEVIFRFKDDGVLAIDMTRSGISSTAAATWEESVDQLAIIINGEAIKTTYTIKDDVLSIYFTIQDQNVAFTLNRI
ncbi:MAG: hypothetical protein IJC56_11570 [Clostridia bacterium]|nr:hypothetical protein [Clostridia bacterium]